MAYTPTEWQTGDIVTAEKLNKLENGVADSSGGILAVDVNLEKDTSTPFLNKTFAEIASALENNIQVVAFEKEDGNKFYAHPVFFAGYEKEEYHVKILANNELALPSLETYVAEEVDAYPIYQRDDDDPIIS